MTHHSKFLLGAITLALLQACTAVPVENDQLIAAQAEFKTVQATPEVPAMASAELREAEVTLEQARAAWVRQAPRTEVNHLSYLASKQLAIAKTTASQRQAERAIDEAQGQRQQTLLLARTQEAQTAQRDAQTAQRDAQTAQRDALTAQRDAQAAQRDATVATQQATLAAGRTAQARQDAQSAEATAAQLQARLDALDAKPSERGMVVTIGDLLFDTNSAVLKPGAAQSVQRLGTFLQTYPQRNALIEGYTDSVGAPAANMALSERRAAAVRSALMAFGVVGERLATHGYGEGYAVGSNQTAEGRLSNRRVEVVLSDDSGKTQAR